LNHLYGGIGEPEATIIDVFICKLRRKLVENGAEGLSVDNVWGQGYVLHETRDYQVLKKAGWPSPGCLGLAHTLTAKPSLLNS